MYIIFGKYSVLFNNLGMLYLVNIWTNVVLASQKYDICKMSSSGYEYIGKISQTGNGNECEYWETVILPPAITKYNFPDGNLRTARNYCRNPDNSTTGPWCFIKNVNNGGGEASNSLKRENCTIPICSTAEVNCKETGPGMEYSGNIQKSIFENECLHWTVINSEGEIDKFIPEGSIILAGKSCRNPTDNPVGPWCYVLNEEEENEEEEDKGSTKWHKESCDIPICFNNRQSITVILNKFNTDIENYYTHFSRINGENEEIRFSIKLWDPVDWYNGEIKIAVSLLPVPATGLQLREWGIGYELIIRNAGAGVTPHSDEDESWTDVPRLVSGIHWSDLKLAWSNGFVTLIPVGKEKPYFIHEYKKNENGILSELGNNQINYISVMGTTAFWNITQTSTSNEQEEKCVEHIVFGQNKVTRYWVFFMASLNKFVNFYLRCSVECIIDMRMSPRQELPRIQLVVKNHGGKTIFGNIVSEIRLNLFKNDGTIQSLLKNKLTTTFSYWSWEEFSISISGERMNMLMTKSTGTETLFDITDRSIQGIKWYGVMSTGISHWTFYCTPLVKEFEAVPPECSVSSLDKEYEGHQWVTNKGHPCLPWVANIGNFQDDNFPDGNISAALNYCRNPTSDGRGAYCYTADLTGGISINKESCHVRKCKFKDCRIAGTGNDFMGKISTTITGRECQAWTSDSPHVPEKVYMKDEFFPDRTVADAENYCRDPTSQLGGPWCYTTDPKVSIDLCNVPDCYKPESCTILVKGVVSNKIFIVPRWRAFGLPMWIKMWDPNIVTGLILSIYPAIGTYHYRLILGDDNNERIKLYFKSPRDNQLLKQKTIDHFLSSGRWIGIIIDIQDDSISITWEGTPNPFFVWRRGSHESVSPVNAMYLSYDAKSEENQGSVGLNFPCDICQTQICNRIKLGNRMFYPFNIWLENSTSLVRNITFYLRGNGMFIVNLYTLPDRLADGKLIIDDGVAKNIIEVQLKVRKFIGRTAIHTSLGPSIQDNSWTKFTLITGDVEGSLHMNDSLLMKWKTQALQYFYYFSPECTQRIMWTANCEPPQLDGTPVNGDWSAWSAWECSVSCGGGRGTRRRQCTNPVPSMFGSFCKGSSTDTGTCNQIPCGEMSISTINKIRQYLSSNATNLQVQEHQTFAIECNTKALKLIKNESPKTMIHWMKNGENIGRIVPIVDIQPEEFQIEIQSANLSDTGVYACVAIIDAQEFETVDITAVIVKTSHLHTNILRTGQKLRLKANSLLLNELYDNLRLTWMLNNKIYKEYDIYDLRFIENEIINPVNRNHTGEWISIVFQDQLRLNWTTSWYNVLVKKKATWATYILEEDLLRGQIGDNELIVYITMAVVFLIVIALTIAFTIFILRVTKSFNETKT